MAGDGWRRGPTRGRRTVLALAAGTIAASLAWPATPVAAGTTTVRLEGSYLYVDVQGGATTVTLACTGGSLHVDGAAVGLACADLYQATITGGPGDDVLDSTGVGEADLHPNARIVLDGGPGADRLIDGPARARLITDRDTDQVEAGGGMDVVYAQEGGIVDAGEGDDTVYAGDRALVDLGPGDDVLDSWGTGWMVTGADGGEGDDDYLLRTEGVPDEVFVEPQADGTVRVVGTSATEAQLVTVPTSFESLWIQTVGSDRTWVDGFPRAFPITIYAGRGDRDASAEIWAKGPWNTAGSFGYTQPGKARIYLDWVHDRQVIDEPKTDDELFVHGAIHHLIGGHPTDAEVAATADRLTAGATTRTNVAAELTGLERWRQNEVRRVYLAYLRRGVDPEGSAFYTARLAEGMHANSIRATVLGSNEYFGYRGDNVLAQYIASVYEDVLHRPVDPQGADYWLRRLQSGLPRRALAAKLISTDEPARELVRYQYRDLLGREPSASELAAWTGPVRDSAAGERVLQVALVASSEYLERIR